MIYLVPLSNLLKSFFYLYFQLAASRDAYERVLRTTPDHSKVLQHLGGLYLRESTNFHDPEKCIKYITASLEHGELPSIWCPSLC